MPYKAEDLEYYNYDNRANTELNTYARPAKLPVNTDFAQYDTIMLGYPNNLVFKTFDKAIGANPGVKPLFSL